VTIEVFPGAPITVAPAGGVSPVDRLSAAVPYFPAARWIVLPSGALLTAVTMSQGCAWLQSSTAVPVGLAYLSGGARA
jgi:hypothetical protein